MVKSMGRPGSAAGFTLIELLLVLALTGLIAVAGLKYYRTAVTQVQVSVHEDRRELVFAALEEYFWRNCRNSSANPQPTIASLVATGIIDDTQDFVDPVGNGLLVPSVIWSEPSRLQVSLSFSVRGGSAGWAGTLSADSVSGNTLIWERSALLSTNSLFAMRAGMNDMYEDSLSCNQYFSGEGS